MRLFFRYLFPLTYFQATRLNRWDLVAYNGLVEWIPALALSLYFQSATLITAGVVLASYLAFICVYEIGYITNDAFSEKFEESPRGRSGQLGSSKAVVWALVVTRLVFWILISFGLGVLDNPIWVAFHLALLSTFVLHNVLVNEHRVATFFCLSTFRYFAPMIVTVPPVVLTILIPAVLLNNSLYRTTVYVRNKTTGLQDKPSIKSKLAFYLACVPTSIFLSVFFGSLLPLVVCVYFILIWLLYWLTSRFSRRAVST